MLKHRICDVHAEAIGAVALPNKKFMELGSLTYLTICVSYVLIESWPKASYTHQAHENVNSISILSTTIKIIKICRLLMEIFYDE
ncbi:unnamed protein product [Rhizophagus irregularis]|nr:unnamed protein product [Rhizophagus irregularis]